MAEASQPANRDLTLPHKYLICILQEPADVPKVVASILRRIPKLFDNAGTSLAIQGPNRVRWLFQIKINLCPQNLAQISFLVDVLWVCRFRQNGISSYLLYPSLVTVS
jgi:hypothetical protein